MHPLQLKSILKEAWEKVKGAKKAFFFLTLTFGVVQLILFFLKTYLENFFAPHLAIVNISTSLLGMFIFSPFLTGYYMLGVKRARGDMVNINEGFKYFSKILHLFITQFLCLGTLICIFFCLTYIGFGLLGFLLKAPPIIFHIGLTVLAIVYFMLFLTLLALLNFTLILVADQNKSPWQAYKSSIKTSLPYFKTLFLVHLIFILTDFLGILFFGIGLIWAIPFSYITIGILYREIFISKIKA